MLPNSCSMLFKDLFKKANIKYPGVGEAEFLKYHTTILKDRIQAQPRNRFILDNSKRPNASGLFEYVLWDSEIFDMNIGRLDYFIGSSGCKASFRENVIKDIFYLSKKNKLKFMLARINSGDFQSAQILEKYGFILTDILVSLSVILKKQDIIKLPAGIRGYEVSDLKAVLNIAKNSFVFNRFFNDSRLNSANVKYVYEKWVKDVCLNNKSDVLVYEDNSGLLGFVICKLDKLSKNIFGYSIGQIDLVAVRPGLKGKGIGRKLVQAGLYKFSKDAVAIVEIRAQHANILAVNSFLKSGFKEYNSGLTLPAGMVFHKWFD